MRYCNFNSFIQFAFIQISQIINESLSPLKNIKLEFQFYLLIYDVKANKWWNNYLISLITNFNFFDSENENTFNHYNQMNQDWCWVTKSQFQIPRTSNSEWYPITRCTLPIAKLGLK